MLLKTLLLRYVIKSSELTSSSLLYQIKPGEIIGVLKKEYKDRPLLGRVKEAKASAVTIEWLMGSYTGKWREWKGREGKEVVIYTDEIERKDIIHRNIQLTSTMHLTLSDVKILKEKYA